MGIYLYVYLLKDAVKSIHAYPIIQIFKKSQNHVVLSADAVLPINICIMIFWVKDQWCTI